MTETTKWFMVIIIVNVFQGVGSSTTSMGPFLSFEACDAARQRIYEQTKQQKSS